MIELSLREERGVLISAAQHVPSSRVAYASTAWTSAGEVIPESQFVRHKDEPYKMEIPEFYTELGGNFMFGGVYFDHYGHFLLETLSRMWQIRKSDCKIIWLKPDPKLRLTSYQQDIFELLGINPVRHLFCRGGVKVDNILVPSPGSIIGRGMNPQLGEALGVFPFSEPQRGKSVWLSRSKLADRKSKVENESELEEILIDAGWDVIHPETMRVPDQLAAMSNAEIVAGFDGSAFHTLLLADKPQCHQIILPRGAVKKISHSFQAISTAKGMTQEMLIPEGIVVSAEGGRGSAKAMMSSPKIVFDQLARRIDARRSLSIL